MVHFNHYEVVAGDATSKCVNGGNERFYKLMGSDEVFTLPDKA